MDLLGDRPYPVVREAPEGVRHHLEIGIEMAGALLAGERRKEGGVAVPGDELRQGLGPARTGRPLLFPPERPRHNVVHRIGGERGGDACLDLAGLAVVEGGPGRVHRGSCVGDVVGDHLVGVRTPRKGHASGSSAHHLAGQPHRDARSGQIGHG